MILVLISGACSFKQETKSSLNILLFFGTLDSINEIEWKSLDVSFESTDVDVIFSFDVFESSVQISALRMSIIT